MDLKFSYSLSEIISTFDNFRKLLSYMLNSSHIVAINLNGKTTIPLYAGFNLVTTNSNRSNLTMSFHKRNNRKHAC